MAAYRDPGSLPPLLAGTLGGLLATWTTFVPCFLWIGLGAPFIERLRDNKPLSGALAGHHRRGGRRDPEPGDLVRVAHLVPRHRARRRLRLRLRHPGLDERRHWALLLSFAAMVAIFRFKAGTMQVLAACSPPASCLYLAGAVGREAPARGFLILGGALMTGPAFAQTATTIDIGAMPTGAAPPGFNLWAYWPWREGLNGKWSPIRAPQDRRQSPDEQG